MVEHAGYGYGKSQTISNAVTIGSFKIFGESLNIAESEVVTGQILRAYGLSESQALNEARGGLILLAYGQSLSQAQANAYLHKTINIELLTDPSLIVKFQSLIGGGGVLTYKVGTPDVATFWDIIGVNTDGFDEPPHGSLRWHYVKADKAGLAANVYVAPKDPALAGHRDRIIVRRANA